MSRRSRRAALLGVVTLLLVVLALGEGVAARGGRGGGRISRGGPAARGSLGPHQPRIDRGEYTRHGPAASGRLDWRHRDQVQYLDQGERQERREERQDWRDDDQVQHLDQGERQERREERREERQDWRDDAREEWQESIEDRYDDYYYYDDGYYYGDGYYYDDGYYEDDAESLVYGTLPCSQPTVMALDGVLYYGCGSTWYIRVYYFGEVAYTVVENPPGY
jgi:hypothetical protein